MRYANAVDVSRDETRYYPMTYVSPDGQETQYELQQIRPADGSRPTYVVSESELNQGPGFDQAGTRVGVAHEGAAAAVALNNPEAFPESTREIRPREVNLYQQLPDGNFNHVSFREIGRNGGSNVDTEMQQNHPDDYQKAQANREPMPPQDVEFTESNRTLYSREQVEERVGAELRAPDQTPQQQYDQMMNEQWKELSGPSSFDRAAERAARPPQEAEVSQAAEPQQARESNQAADAHQAPEPEQAQTEASAQAAGINQQAAVAQQQAAAQQQASADAQRSSEQVQQMNEHVQQQTR